MEILELEQKYVELQNFLNEPSSKRIKLIRISEFYDLVLSASNLSLIEAYISEFLPKYFTLIKAIKIRGLNPEVLVKLKDQLSQLNKFDFIQRYGQEIEDSFTILKHKYELLSSWLNGNLTKPSENLIYFPVLEKSESIKVIGFLEIIKVGITDGENKFIIELAESEEDAQLEKQLHLCWEVALDYCKRHIKIIKPNHSVELKFENKLGVYIGDSFGIALTLAFIEEILKHYKSPVIIKINGTIAVSGGIDKSHNVLPTGKMIIRAKVESVFYSDAEIFCVPKVDELWAEERLSELKKKFPKRNLRIIGLTDLEDLLSRRNVVDIRKRNVIERILIYSLKKWKSILLAAVLTIIFIFLFALDLDRNPAMFSQSGNLLKIQNRNGKDLWTVQLNFDPKNVSNDRSRYSRKMIDIDDDGVNEVIIAEEELSSDSYDKGRVACFDKNKNLIWEYNFRDTVSTFRKWTNNYQISIIDTATINKRKVILLMARNIPNFSNAIFKLDVVTGKRFDSTATLWNAGAITNAMIGDFNEDNEKEVVGTGMHNGYEKAILFSINLDRLIGQTPAPDRYRFNNMPFAEMNKFILLPHTDYGKLFWRSNIVSLNGLYFVPNSKELVITTLEGFEKPIAFFYGFSNKLDFRWVDCSDNAQQLRDSLVSQGILKPPYTNTNEYFDILKNEIRYWKQERFVKIDDIKK